MESTQPGRTSRRCILDWRSTPSTPIVRERLTGAVFDYFAGMRLPDHPTIYDHLVLSLREKDFIATFNWDPFLLQAVERLPHGVKPPQMRFLHGCVGVGYCAHHEPVTFGRIGMECRQCGQRTIGSRLLYPVTQKNYNADPFQRRQLA